MSNENNRQFTSNSDFKAACEAAGVQPTKRQASKFRMGKGRAFKVGRLLVSGQK
jgi:hypothetical protein